MPGGLLVTTLMIDLVAMTVTEAADVVKRKLGNV
jgi:hypothetical protein